MYVYIHIGWGIYLRSIVSCGIGLGTQLRCLSWSFNFVVSSYQSSQHRPILTIFVRSMAIGGTVYVYVGGYGEGRKKKHPVRVLLSDIGFATNYNIMLFLAICKQSHGPRLAVS